MTKSPETTGSDDSEHLHSIEKWGWLDLSDPEVSPDTATEFRRRFERNYPDQQHMDTEHFKAWLSSLFKHSKLFELTSEDEEELARQYDQPWPDAQSESLPPEDAAPDSRSELPPDD